MSNKSPTLFDDQPENAPDASSAAGKSFIDRLLKVRRSMTPDEQRFGLPKLNLLIEELRSLTRATATQREEMVLYAIERQGATTPTEISEDTRLHREVVDELIQSMIEKDLIYQVRRHVPGSDRPQYALKSRRVPSPEVDEVLERSDVKWWDSEI